MTLIVSENGASVAVIKRPGGSVEVGVSGDDAMVTAPLDDAARRRLIEALGGVPADEPAWTGKTDPLPGTQNQAVSLVALELPPGTEIEVHVRRPT